MTRLLLVTVVLLLRLALPAPALAQTAPNGLVPKLRAADTVTIPAGEVVPHDLYLAGGQVQVNGSVQGDLVVAGGQVDVNGAVAGDLLVAGGTISINGPVGGDLRITGGQATVTSAVSEDIAFAGGTLNVTPAARVAGDVLLSAGRATVGGPVVGSVLGSAGSYTSGGLVGGREAVAMQEASAKRPVTPGEWIANLLRRYFGILLAGALLVAFLPRLTQEASAALRLRTLPSLGVGVLGLVGVVAALIATIVLTVLLAIIFGALTLGGLVGLTVAGGVLAAMATVFAFVLVAAYLAHAVVGMALGRFVLRRPPAVGEERPDGWLPYAAVAFGVLVVVVVTSVPWVGPALGTLSFLLGTGALLLAAWQRWQERRPEAAAREMPEHEPAQRVEEPVAPVPPARAA